MLKAACKCVYCGRLDAVDNKDIETIYLFNDKKDAYKFTYYLCSKCRKMNFVQVDNVESRELAKKCRKCATKAIYEKKQESEKDFRKIDEKLSKVRKRLYRNVKGKNFYDRKGNLIIKELTFAEGSGII